MSGSNAISGIVIVGAIIVAGTVGGLLGAILGVVAVTLATINVVGGYLVTDRMLRMFHRSDDDGVKRGLWTNPHRFSTT